jgi:hypothetical protein
MWLLMNWTKFVVCVVIAAGGIWLVGAFFMLGE